MKISPKNIIQSVYYNEIRGFSREVKKPNVQHTWELNFSTCFEMDCKIYFVKKNYDLFRITAF
jgi:hypothetical protein